MEQTDQKYDKVLEILKKSKPVLSSTDEIEENVLRRISVNKKTGTYPSNLIDFLFGWTSVGWVRRSLVTASFLLVIAFVFQQGIILKQINQLSRMIDTSEKEAIGVSTRYLNRQNQMFRFTNRRFAIGKRAITEKKVDELLKSIDQLQKEYKDLYEMIEADPELKRLIEKKLSEINGNKIKL